MPVAVRVLPVREEALRHDEVQIVLGARHGDVEQPPLLLDLGRRAGAEVGGDAAVDDVEHEDRLPFLPLGGVDGREDEIVLVEQRRAGLVAGGVGRIERELGEEALARRIAAGDLLELHRDRRGAARRPRACAPDAARTSGARSSSSAGQPRLADTQRAHGLDEAGPARRRRAGGAGMSASAAIGSAAPAMRSSTRCAVAGPTPGSSCSTRKPATRSRGFSAKRSSASTSLTCAASRNLRPPNLTNGMLRRVSSISSGPL